MCVTCVDCSVPIARKGLRGRLPKRCDTCNKLHVSKKARQRTKEYRDKHGTNYKPPSYVRRMQETVACCVCGQQTLPRGKTGPRRLRCDSCNKTHSKQLAAESYKRSKARHQHACKQCGKMFLCALKSQQTCSRECGHLLSRRRVVLTCHNPSCGKQFEVQKKQANDGRLFCSRECSYPPKSICQNPLCKKSFRPSIYHKTMCSDCTQERKGALRYSKGALFI